MRTFEWDENKRASNFLKHRVDFMDAINIFAGRTVERLDTRRDYGEARHIALGEVGGRVMVVVFTDRGDARRIISARGARQDEQRTYHAACAGGGAVQD